MSGTPRRPGDGREFERRAARQWIGLGVAIVPVVYGLFVLVRGEVFLPLRVLVGHHWVSVTGPAATGFAFAYVAVGLLIHAHWYWRLHDRLQAWYGLLRVASITAFLASIGYAVIMTYR